MFEIFNVWKNWNLGWLWTFLFLLLGLGALPGCMAINPAGELRQLLADPVVQSTLEKWSASASITNPQFEAYLINGVGIRIIGADVSANANGDVRSPGVAASQPVP